MNKKLIITEEQYKKLKFHLLESTFDVMANKVIQNNDIITITTNGKKLEYKVIDNYGGQIYMDNVKDGTRVFLTPSSFQDNKISINVAQNETEKNENPPKGNTWRKLNLMNIEDITVSRNGEIIDGTNLDPAELAKNKKEKNKQNEKVQGFIDTLLDINKGETLILDIGNIKLGLNYYSQSGNSLLFTITDETKQVLKKENIEYISIDLDEKKITIDDKSQINLKLIEMYQDKSKKESDVKIEDWEIINTSTDDEENSDKKNEFLEALNGMNKGKTLILESTGDNKLELNFWKREKEDLLVLTVSKKTEEELNLKDVISIFLYYDNISVDKDDNIVVKLISYNRNEGGSPIKKEENITLKSWDIVGGSSEDKTENKIDPEKFMQMLSGDTQLRAAFYSKPSFFQSFWAELTSKDPNEKATGYVLVKNLLDDYADKKIAEKLGDNFKRSGAVSFMPLTNVKLLYKDIKGNSKYFTLERGIQYGKRREEETVTRKDFDMGYSSEYGLVLINKKFNFEILVKERTDESNVYICDVIKLYTEPSKENPRKTVTVESEPIKDVKIKFFQSPGYDSEGNKEKDKENKDQK